MAKGFFDEDITENLNNPPKHIKGLVCSVKNCVYHDSEGYCTAYSVHILSLIHILIFQIPASPTIPSRNLKPKHPALW